MKHKLLTIFLVLSAVVCLCFGLAACDLFGNSGVGDSGNTEQEETKKPDEGKEPHVHDFTDYVYNGDATCTEDGMETGKCSCGETYTRAKSGTALGHDTELHAGTATCTEAGTLDYWRCSRCHKDFIDEEGTAEIEEYETNVPLGHEFTAENKCVRYDKCKTAWEYTEGLTYNLNWDNSSYSVSGIGTASGDIVIPYGYQGKFVTWIEYNAFEDRSELTSITIPGSVAYIGYLAFSYCSELTSVTISDGVISIGEGAFEGCSGLTSITIPDSVTSIGNATFAKCDGLTSIEIPDSVTSIGIGAFSGCSGLTSITIPDRVASIESQAFSGCSGLTSITIPDSVTSIGNNAFYGCSGLEHITVSEDNKVYRSEQDCLIEIETSTLILGCKNSVIPDSVTEIGEYAFNGCSELINVTIGIGVTSIGAYAFNDCGGLTNITIPDRVTEIGDWAFCLCTKLTSVTIGSGVTSIGEKAFYCCSSLTRVYITDLSAWCRIDFADSDSNPLCYADLYVDNAELKELIIPNEITEIKNYAFYACRGLTSVTIGNSVTEIGGYAFNYCIWLTDIQFKGTVKEWQAIEKGDNWDYQTDNYTITCTDGTIDKEGNVTYNK